MTLDVSQFRFGLRESAKPIGLPKLTSVAEIPDAPATFDHTNGFSGFQMLGNGPDPTLTVHKGQPVGDCGFVMTVNAALVDGLETGESFTMPSSNLVVTDYLRYDHGQDLGVSNPQLFTYWHKVGLPWAATSTNPDGKLHSWADVNANDWDETMAATNAFGCVALEIVVWQSMMEATQAGEPWDWSRSTDTTPLGGHDVLGFARVDLDDGVLATWGMRQQFTKAWFKHAVQGASVLLTPAQIAAKGNGYGVDEERLESFMEGLAA